MGATDRRNRTDSRTPRSSLLCVRIFLLLIFVSLTALTVIATRVIHKMSSQLKEQESIINKLQKIVQAHEDFGNRFKTTETDSDVINKVADLELSITKVESDLQKSLSDTTASIEFLLNATMANLDNTVKAAQIEIQQEVDTVKDDVDQYVQTTQDQFSVENSFMIYQIAGTFTLVACLISMWHMTGHVRRFKKPIVQRKILAILWMSPIYSVTSWLSLIFPNYEGYLAIIKDFYEAYIIYQFLSFLISVLGQGNRETAVDLLAQHADNLEPPMRMFGWYRGSYAYENPRALAAAVLLQSQAFAMQFVFFKPMTSIAMFTCNSLGYYGHGTLDYRSPQFWINIVQNLSVFMAFSGLLKFYHATQDQLTWCRPLPKFLCIKGIVFMTFWQGLVIELLADSTNTNEMPGEVKDRDIWGKQVQNFVICLEMLLFSIAHFNCFPTEEWQEGYRPAVEQNVSMGDNMAFGDFLNDFKLILGRAIKRQKKEKMDASKLTNQNHDDEEEPLLEVNREEILDSQSTKKGVKKNKKPFRFLSRIRSRSKR